MSDKTIYSVLYLAILGLALLSAALFFSPMPEPEPVPLPTGLYVVGTHFLDEHGVLGSVPYEGNIYREGGSYVKCMDWSDGQRSWEYSPQWIDLTWGFADPNLRGNERPELEM